MDTEKLATLINYILVNEATHYQETIETYGLDSDEAKGHIYNLARDTLVGLGFTL